MRERERERERETHTHINGVFRKSFTISDQRRP